MAIKLIFIVCAMLEAVDLMASTKDELRDAMGVPEDSFPEVLHRLSSMVINAMGVKETVDAKINGKKVMVFAKSWCGYCNMAKKALAKYIGNELSAEDYEVWDIDNEAQENAIQDYLGKLTGARSVPRVFINGKCIGGGTETQDADKSGELRRMIAAV